VVSDKLAEVRRAAPTKTRQKRKRSEVWITSFNPAPSLALALSGILQVKVKV
jgi:hypothetical protein